MVVQTGCRLHVDHQCVIQNRTSAPTGIITTAGSVLIGLKPLVPIARPLVHTIILKLKQYTANDPELIEASAGCQTHSFLRGVGADGYVGIAPEANAAQRAEAVWPLRAEAQQKEL